MALTKNGWKPLETFSLSSKETWLQRKFLTNICNKKTVNSDELDLKMLQNSTIWNIIHRLSTFLLDPWICCTFTIQLQPYIYIHIIQKKVTHCISFHIITLKFSAKIVFEIQTPKVFCVFSVHIHQNVECLTIKLCSALRSNKLFASCNPKLLLDIVLGLCLRPMLRKIVLFAAQMTSPDVDLWSYEICFGYQKIQYSLLLFTLQQKYMYICWWPLTTAKLGQYV